jgi:hypothetical protein
MGPCPHCGARLVKKPHGPAIVHAKDGRTFVLRDDKEGAYVPLCHRPWFDPRSVHDWGILLREVRAGDFVIEVDSFEALRAVESEEFRSRRRGTLLYQQWGRILPTGGRHYLGLDEASAQKVAETIAKGPTREILLLCSMFAQGGMRRFAETLARSSPGQLEFAGFLWYFTGDDLTDDPERATELAEAARLLGLKRVSILTAKFDDACEVRLVEGLRGNKALERFAVFEKDDAKTWPRIPTPKIDALFLE